MSDNHFRKMTQNKNMKGDNSSVKSKYILFNPADFHTILLTLSHLWNGVTLCNVKSKFFSSKSTCICSFFSKHKKKSTQNIFIKQKTKKWVHIVGQRRYDCSQSLKSIEQDQWSVYWKKWGYYIWHARTALRKIRWPCRIV